MEQEFCPVCGEKTRYLVPYFNREVRCNCRCDERRWEQSRQSLAQQERDTRRTKCFGTSILKGCTFDADDRRRPELTELCIRYADGIGELLSQQGATGLLIYGGVGTGKSYLAAAVANRLIDRGYRVKWLSATEVVTVLFSAQDRQEVLEEWSRNFDMIVLDDLGVESSRDFSQERLWDFVERMYTCGKPLIITTNLTKDELSKAADIRRRRIFDRILQMCRPIALEGASRRREAAPRNWQRMDAQLRRRT